MIAPTLRPGHLAEIAMDGNGTRTPPEMTVYDSLSGKEIQKPAGARGDG
jgi:hypothetical protein